MTSRIWVGVGLVALCAPALAAAQQAGGDVARNWAAISACGAIENADKRHACMDGVLRDAGVLSEARIARNVRQEFGKEGRAEKPAKVAKAPKAPAAAPTRAEEIDQLVTTIRSVATVGYKQLRVTTADGSVWEQTQAAEFNSDPKPGDGFAIERASLGSYMCRFGRAKSYRCRRVD